jgi:hypothetical protein
MPQVLWLMVEVLLLELQQEPEPLAHLEHQDQASQ